MRDTAHTGRAPGAMLGGTGARQAARESRGAGRRRGSSLPAAPPRIDGAVIRSTHTLGIAAGLPNRAALTSAAAVAGAGAGAGSAGCTGRTRGG